MSRPLSALMALLLCACSLVTPLPGEPTRELLQELPAGLPHSAPGRAVIMVESPVTDPVYDTTRIAYTRRAFEIAYFNDHEWAEPPPQMIQSLLIAAIEATGRFARVTAPPDFAGYDLRLKSRLLTLTQDYTASPPVLHVAMRFQLWDRKSGQVIAARESTVDEPIAGHDAHAGVVAANHAVARIVGQAVRLLLDHAAP